MTTVPACQRVDDISHNATDKEAPVNIRDDNPENGKFIAAAHELDTLREEFPGFSIWPENIVGRVRYVARRQYLGLRPHTVVTADLGEMRAALSAGPGPRDAPRRGAPRQRGTGGSG
jgi:hypothetical protein